MLRFSSNPNLGQATTTSIKQCLDSFGFILMGKRDGSNRIILIHLGSLVQKTGAICIKSSNKYKFPYKKVKH